LLNRYINFRGLTNINAKRKWVEGLPFRSEINANEVITCLQDEKGMEYEVDPETIGQNTCIKDINDKKIYVGDIVEYICECGHKCLGVIKLGEYEQSDGECLGEKCIGFYIDRVKITPGEWEVNEDLTNSYNYTKNVSLLYFDISNIEIIGDIYNNPELLKD